MSKGSSGNPEIDVDRVVWDPIYRQHVKRLLAQHGDTDPLVEEWEADFGSAFQIAFQPIVDMTRRRVFAYEALVRDLNGRSAEAFLDQLSSDRRKVFDHLCRVQALKAAVDLDLKAYLSLNFLPCSLLDERFNIDQTVRWARELGFPPQRLMLEISEKEAFEAKADIFKTAAANGVLIAVDDFGKGYSGLSLLLEMRPQLIKLDMSLIRGIDTDHRRQAMVTSILRLSGLLGQTLIAEGVETEEEAATLQKLGIFLMQGYHFARPAIGVLPQVQFEDQSGVGMRQVSAIGRKQSKRG